MTRTASICRNTESQISSLQLQTSSCHVPTISKVLHTPDMTTHRQEESAGEWVQVYHSIVSTCTLSCSETPEHPLTKIHNADDGQHCKQSPTGQSLKMTAQHKVRIWYRCLGKQYLIPVGGQEQHLVSHNLQLFTTVQQVS